MKKTLFTASLITCLMASTAAFAGGGHEGYTTSNTDSTSPSSSYASSMRNGTDSWYMTVSGVYDWLSDDTLGIGATAGNASFNNGGGALVALGHEVDYGWGKGGRAELELGWRENSLDSYTPTGGAEASGSGHVDAYSAMVNGYYDFKNTSRFTPYLGAGVGAADIVAQNITAAGIAGNQDDNDIVFAYQGIAGVNYALNQNWSVQAEYRYFGTSHAQLTSSAGVSPGFDFDTNNVVVGLKYNFY